ncbi:MAG TPA: HK97 family phage prohead protease [Defluviitaleaceae bacterium]|nr:HK97 family phage prohead protease [Defluviitaleaceae bacterium]
MITKDRNYRCFEVRVGEEQNIIEGYAVIFDTAETMYEYDGIAYKEEIRTGAFDKTDMKDVVLNFNHSGKPVARTKNNTLQLTVDQVGLKVRADLSGTEEGRRLYEEVKGGYLDKMSFAFTINAEEYNRETRTRSITDIKRLYDVAIVDIPAYESTSVYARSFFKAEAERELAEAREIEQKKQRLKLKIELEVNNG